MKRLKYIKNKQDLRAVIQQEFSEVFDDVANRMMERLDEIIVRDTYTYDYYPNKRYWGGNGTPTFEFRESWKKTNDLGINNLSVGIEFDPSGISHAHDSIIKYGGNPLDVSTFLAELLNVDGYTSSLAWMNSKGEGVMVSKRRKPYWDNFIKEMTKGGKIRSWIKQEALAKGLNVK